MIVALVVVACVAIAALVVLAAIQASERQRWAEERRVLVDRAIARHSGEVIAFDRAQKPRPDREPTPLLEGLT